MTKENNMIPAPAGLVARYKLEDGHGKAHGPACESSLSTTTTSPW
jgi:hypothetical protein